MNPYSLSHLRDQDLLRDLRAMVGRERTATAALLAHIAEVDARRLFAPAGYSCMYDYCVRELRLSEDAALKRIRAARAARRFPAVFGALACGRLHLSGVALVAKYLTSEHVNPDSAAELLSATEKKTCSEIEMLLAERFPRPDLPAGVEPLHGNRVWSGQTLLAARPVDASSNSGARDDAGTLPAAGPAADPAPWARVKPLSAERFALQVTIGQETHDKLEYARALLGHAVPSGDLAEVLDRALEALVIQLEKQKFAATSRPRAQRSSADPRHIPAHVKRAVWQRDGGQCTFVAEGGRRCAERTRLEYDHVDPVACGGEATVPGIRLRCRAHNQYEAECAFGAGFMASRREAARAAAAETRAAREAARAQAAAEARTARDAAKAQAAAEARAARDAAKAQDAARREEARARAAARRDQARAQAAARKAAERVQMAAERDPERSVIPWLRQLGYRLDDARAAAALCENMRDASMEQRIKAALRPFRAPAVSGGCASRAGPP